MNTAQHVTQFGSSRSNRFGSVQIIDAPESHYSLVTLIAVANVLHPVRDYVEKISINANLKYTLKVTLDGRGT